MSGPAVHTERLLLRPWRESDREPLAAMSADPEVMEHFPSRMTRAESDALFDRLVAHFDRHGFGFWAVELPGRASCVGLLGLAVPSFHAAFTPCVEIGWRLARPYWGSGYATEGAKAALSFGFDRLALREVVAFTVPANHRSRQVMNRLGMRHHPEDDFDHPKLPEGHPLRRHVFYRLSAATWRASSDATRES